MFASVWKPASAATTAPASTSLGEAQLAKRRSRPLQHRHQQRVLLGFAEGLRVHHHLMLAVHARHPVVALDAPLRGLHLGTVVVGEVALLHPPAGPDLVRVALKKPPDLLQRRLEGLDLLAPRHPQRFLVPRRVGVAVTAHQMLNRTFHLRDLLLEVPPGAAPLLGGIARQLHPIDGEHLSPDQPQLVTHQEHVPEHGDDLPVERRNEICDRREVGRAVGRQRHEQDILPTQPGNLAAGGHAAGVGIKDDFEKDGRVVGRRPHLVVTVPGFEHRQIDLLVDQAAQRSLERARQDLALEAHRHELQLIVAVGLKPRHRSSSSCEVVALFTRETRRRRFQGFSTGSTTAVGGHYLASLIQMSLHRVVGHRPLGGPIHRIHMLEHHGIYSGDALVADTYSEEEKSSTQYYAAPAVALAAAAYATLPVDVFVVFVAAISASYTAHVYVHTQYHLSRSWLRRFGWFHTRRNLHYAPAVRRR